MKLLYLFFTHQKNLEKIYHNKKKYLDFSIIICGDSETRYNKEKNILFIECNDLYEGLPEKIIKAFKFIVESSLFSKYTHFVKLDEDMHIINYMPHQALKYIDYGGKDIGVEHPENPIIQKDENTQKT